MLDKILKLKRLTGMYLHTPDIIKRLEFRQNNDKLEFTKYRGDEISQEVLESKNKYFQHELYHLLMFNHLRNQYNSCYTFIEDDFWLEIKNCIKKPSTMLGKVFELSG